MMMMMNEKQIGKQVRLKNRRVTLQLDPNVNERARWLVGFTRLVDRKTRDVRRTKIRLTDEAMGALVALYFHMRDQHASDQHVSDHKIERRK